MVYIPLEGWKTIRKIGTGSFGTVYEIQREFFGDTEKAALKVISIPQDPSEVEDLRSEGYTQKNIEQHYQESLQSIVREYALMAKLKGSGNVVYCDDIRYSQQEDGIGWTVMIKMELLTPLMRTLPSFHEESRIIQLGIDICNALVLCGERNIVHRDIKPQNIFVAEDGVAKLGDFGIAKESVRTTSGTKIGTYKYMAPEVYNHKPYGPKSDIYALGMVLYWLLNEYRTPFLPLPPQIPTASMEDNARERRFRGDELPPPNRGTERLKSIVLKACAFSPEDRFATAEEMRACLREAQKETVVRNPRCLNASEDERDDMKSGTEGTVGVLHRIECRPLETATRKQETKPISECNTQAGETLFIDQAVTVALRGENHAVRQSNAASTDGNAESDGTVRARPTLQEYEKTESFTGASWTSEKKGLVIAQKNIPSQSAGTGTAQKNKDNESSAPPSQTQNQRKEKKEIAADGQKEDDMPDLGTAEEEAPEEKHAFVTSSIAILLLCVRCFLLALCIVPGVPFFADADDSSDYDTAIEINSLQSYEDYDASVDVNVYTEDLVGADIRAWLVLLQTDVLVEQGTPYLWNLQLTHMRDQTKLQRATVKVHSSVMRKCRVKA